MNYKFVVKRAGYDREQVKKTIGGLHLKNQNLERENKILDEKVNELSEKFVELIAKFHEIEKNAHTKPESEKIALLAMEEATLLIEKANKKAHTIVNSAMKKANVITTDALKIKAEATAFKENVRQLALNVMEYIDNSADLVEKKPAAKLVAKPIKQKDNIKKIKKEKK